MTEDEVESSAYSPISPTPSPQLDICELVGVASTVSSTEMVNLKTVRKRRRREEATRRERERMHILNAAYERLQNALPFIPEGARMPKMTVIETAINYIQDLLDMLEDADDEDLELERNLEVPSDREGCADISTTHRCLCSCHQREQDRYYSF